nr:putative reverse transcriptase domain-containing protein [Tanacetum cinerariifolium]
MSSASSVVTYTSVYNDSELGRIFWGADEELSDGGPEEPQTPPTPQDEDEHEPMFIHPHDPDFVPDPIYPEYIPLEDEHILSTKEHPLPPVGSPTAESPGYVAKSDPKEDPEEYEDDETEDGLVDYPMDGGDDDDSDSSGDNANDEDEEDEEEEEHLAPADSAVVIPTDELASPPEGTKPIIPPPSTDTATTRARITVRLPAAISFPPEAEDDIPEIEIPPRKRLCLFTIGFREVGYGIRDTWIDPTEIVPEIAHMTMGEDMIAQQETIQIVEDEAYAAREAWAHSIRTSQAVHFEFQTHQEQVYAHEFQLQTQLQLQRTKGVVGLTRWIEKMESVFQINGCAVEKQVKFATCTLLDAALTWWNSKIRSLGPDAYSMTWEFVADETEKIDKYVNGLLDNIYESVKALQPKMLDETIKLANDLMDQKLRTYAERQSNNKRKADESFRNNHGHQQQTFKMQNVARVYNMWTEVLATQTLRMLRGRHFKMDFPKLKNKDGERVNGPGWVYAVGNAGRRGNESRDPDLNVVTGTFLLNNRYASILFDTGADRSFISSVFSSLIDIVPTLLGNSYDVELADGKIVGVDIIMRGCTLNFLGHPFNIDLMPVEPGSFDIIIDMDWLRRCHVVIVCDEKLVRIPYGNETLTFCGNKSNNGRESQLTVISCSKAQEYMAKGCQIFLAQISAKKEEDKLEGKQLKDVPVVRDYPEVFLKDLPGLPPARPVEFQIDLILRAAPVARASYRLAPSEMKELSEQLQELFEKGFIRPSFSPWEASVLFVKKKI